MIFQRERERERESHFSRHKVKKNQSNNSNNKNIKKINKYIIIIFIITAIALISTYGIARYKTSLNGNGTASIAKWSFKVKSSGSETLDIPDFSKTRTDGNNKVASNKIAPGTSGEFQIEIDARENETALTYDIDVKFKDKPQNLRFYIDEERTSELELKDNAMQVSGFLSLDDIQNIVTRKVYWDWKYETGNTTEEIEKNDIIDSEDMGKNFGMEISVTGTQARSTETKQDYAIAYVGNGATSGTVYADSSVSEGNKTAKTNNLKKEYTINLNANGGTVETKTIISQCNFSHWSTDGRNSDVLFYSEKEVNRFNSVWGHNREFIQYADLAPYIDKYGTGCYYLEYDLKSENLENRIITTYFQNGTSAKYSLGNIYNNITTEYKTFYNNVSIKSSNENEKKAMLAFYGTYDTGNFPVAKNVNFDVGRGYKESDSINYTEIQSQLTNNTLKLYAKWIPQEVTLPTPTKEGYTFKGWYTSADGGEKVENTFTPTSNATYYAHWE